MGDHVGIPAAVRFASLFDTLKSFVVGSSLNLLFFFIFMVVLSYLANLTSCIYIHICPLSCQWFWCANGDVPLMVMVPIDGIVRFDLRN
ncbi:hypothetical protein KCU61_g612, partial [Aureobasidium melanogenum]